MFTIVDQFKMRPPAKNQLASRLLTDPRDVADPIPVHVSHAPSAFFTRGNEIPRGIVTQPAAWGLTSGFGGLGSFGALGALPLAPKHVWTLEDLTGSTERAQKFATQARQMSDVPDWTPMSQTAVKAAQDAWLTMEDIANGSGSLAVSVRNKLNTWGAALEAAVQEVDATWDHVIFGLQIQLNPWATQRVNALTRIKSILTEVAAQGRVFQEQLAAERDAEAKKLEAQIKATGGSLTSTLGSRNPATAATTGSSSGVSPMMAVGIIAGVGVLALVVRKAMKKS